MKKFIYVDGVKYRDPSSIKQQKRKTPLVSIDVMCTGPKKKNPKPKAGIWKDTVKVNGDDYEVFNLN